LTVTPTRSAPRHEELLEAARGGNEGAFGRIVEQYQEELHAHCRRMLGSVHDAEDAVQETLLRAWRGLPRFGGRSSLRAWLYRIATNVCLDAIARRRKRPVPVMGHPQTAPRADPGQPPVESAWFVPWRDEPLGLDAGGGSPEARYEQREAVELAFVAALQHLPARQRAVLILREALGFSAREVSESLKTTPASVNSALQRARKAVDQRLPEQTKQATLRSFGDRRLSEAVRAYVDAWAKADIEAIRALVVADANLSKPDRESPWRDNEAGYCLN
jgi:RNA polymerase sigma-70 factor, ECF subfamily